MRLALNDHWTCSNITRSLVWGNVAMTVILTLVASARSSVPTEHPGKISSGPTTLFGVPGITGHTICRSLCMTWENLVAPLCHRATVIIFSHRRRRHRVDTRWKYYFVYILSFAICLGVYRFVQISVTKVHASTLLALWGGGVVCPISRKNGYVTLEWPYIWDLETYPSP